MPEPCKVPATAWAHHHDPQHLSVSQNGRRSWERGPGAPLFPDSHTFLPFPLAHAIFLLCRATCVRAQIKPKAILALYWYPVETQEHLRQQLHLFSQNPWAGGAGSQTPCSPSWGGEQTCANTQWAASNSISSSSLLVRQGTATPSAHSVLMLAKGKICPLLKWYLISGYLRTNQSRKQEATLPIVVHSVSFLHF